MAMLTCLPSPSSGFVVPAVALSAITSIDQEDSLLRALEPTHDPEYGRLPRRAKDKFLCKLGAMVMLDRVANKTIAAAALERQLSIALRLTDDQKDQIRRAEQDLDQVMRGDLKVSLPDDPLNVETVQKGGPIQLASAGRRISGGSLDGL